MVTEEATLFAQIQVLGSAMLDSRNVGQVVSQTSAEDYTGQYRAIYLALRSMYRANQVIDPALVAGQLGDTYRPLLMQIMEQTPTAANCAAYIQLLQDQSRVLRIHQTLDDLRAENTLDGLRPLVDKLNALMVTRSRAHPVTMEDALIAFGKRHEKPRTYQSWGFEALDANIYADRGSYVILGGRPSAGKTALSLQLAYHQSKTCRVGYFSFETGDDLLFDRLMALVGQIPLRRLKRSEMTDDDWKTYSASISPMSAHQLELIPCSGMTVEDIRATALAYHYDVIYIDHAQLIAPANRREDMRNRMTQVSMDLHGLAQQEHIMVVTLSQLSRPPKDKCYEPDMYDLRETGQFEQDADVILMLYIDPDDPDAERRKLKICKNKEGKLGELALDFDGSTQRFRRHRGDFGQQKPAIAGKPRSPQLSLYHLPDDVPVPEKWETKPHMDAKGAAT